MEGGTEHDMLSLENSVSGKEECKDVEEKKVEEKLSEKSETEEGNEAESDSPRKGFLTCTYNMTAAALSQKLSDQL